MYTRIHLVVMAAVLGLFQVATASAAVTHAAANHGLQGVLIESMGAIIVLGVLIYTAKCFVRPGEKDQQHIKRRILREPW